MGYMKFTSHNGAVHYLHALAYTKLKAMLPIAQNAGIPFDITDGWRGEAEQQRAYADGNSKAQFGQSAHNYALAFDVLPLKPDGTFMDYSEVTEDMWAQLGQIGTNLGLKWGGEFHSITDKPHFEISNWQQLMNTAQAPLLTDPPAEYADGGSVTGDGAFA